MQIIVKICKKQKAFAFRAKANKIIIIRHNSTLLYNIQHKRHFVKDKYRQNYLKRGKVMVEINVNDTNAKNILAKHLFSKINDVIVVCIGTEKVVADSLGPRVGSLLNENQVCPLYIYGLQGANIHAQNLSRAMAVIKLLHPNKQLLVIDAAVGDAKQVGKIQLTYGNIAPGAATNKQLDRVGDMSIVGIVANKDMADFYDNSVEKSILVERLSQFIATAIIMASKSNIL